eukprot:m.315867 g.315867  ORF g.315867 m.315867 type:complete len:1110 (-) comp15976_c0_seq2:5424-8753(-)
MQLSLLHGRLSADYVDATVTIPASDFENGIVGFESTATRVLSESDTDGSPQPFSLTVQRTSGSKGRIGVIVAISGGSSDFLTSQVAYVMEDGQTSFEAMFFLADDVEPELNETFTVSLSVANGGAVVDFAARQLELLVLESDAPYGVVSFDGVDTVTAVETPSTNSSVRLPVERGPGMNGNVTVDFVVTSLTANATQGTPRDVYPTSGTIAILDGECCANVTLTILSDEVAEGAETFDVSLTAANGGAELNSDPELTSITLIVSGNDDTIEFLSPATFIEEGTTLTYTLTRSGGALTPASLDVVFDSGSAMIAGPSADLVLTSQTQTLFFESGQRTATFQVTVKDDETPESSESFTIFIENIVGNVVVPQRSLIVTIAASDGGAGVFGFDESDLEHTLLEDAKGGASSNVSLTITRAELDGSGLRDAVALSWRIVSVDSRGPISSDFVSTSGTVDFAPRQTEAQLLVALARDDVPELAELFRVELTAVSSQGALISAGYKAVTLSILANEHPHGVVQFAAVDGAHARVDGGLEETRTVVFRVDRLYGSYGDVMVGVRCTYYNTSTAAGDTSVLEISSAFVQILNGSTSGTIAFNVTGDAALAISGRFTATMFSVEVVGDAATDESATRLPPQIGSRNATSLTVTSTFLAGSLAFDSASLMVIVNEETDHRAVQLTVVRLNGVYSTAHVLWRVSAELSTGQRHDLDNGSGDSDFDLGSGEVVIPQGEAAANFTVLVALDDIPELEERVVIELVAVTDGVAVIPTPPPRAVVVIPENDSPYGLFSIDARTQHVTAYETTADGSTTATLRVVRDRGTVGAVNVQYTMSTNATGEFVTTTNLVVFGDGETSKSFTLFTLHDDVPELDETFLVELSIPGDKGELGTLTTATVTIPANDDPNGVFGFDSTDVVTSIEQTTVSNPTTFTVTRTRGSFAPVTLNYRVLACASQFCNATLSSASADVSPTSSSVTFGMGELAQDIVINTKPDNVPETDEYFVLFLETPANARLSANPRQIMVISGNDDAIGFVQSNYVVQEDAGSVQLIVERVGHRRDSATIAFSITSKCLKLTQKKQGKQAFWEVRSCVAYSTIVSAIHIALVRGCRLCAACPFATS